MSFAATIRLPRTAGPTGRIVMSPTNGDFKLYDGLGYWVVRMAVAMQHDLARRLAVHQLNDRILGVLTAIGDLDINTPSMIADEIGIDRAQVTRVLNDLKARGLIEHSRNSSDGRSRTIALTDAGKDALAIATECAREMNLFFADQMPKDRAASIRNLFKQITENDPVKSIIHPVTQSFKGDA